MLRLYLLQGVYDLLIEEKQEMNAATIIAVIALAAVLFFAIRYLVREKRKGSKCVGCPFAEGCQKASDAAFRDMDCGHNKR